MQNNIRTDLAVELNEEISRKAGRLKGIIVNQHKDKDTGIEVTSLKVTNKAGERMIGKPMGTYITIEARKINEMNVRHVRVWIRPAGQCPSPPAPV